MEKKLIPKGLNSLIMEHLTDAIPSIPSIQYKLPAVTDNSDAAWNRLSVEKPLVYEALYPQRGLININDYIVIGADGNTYISPQLGSMAARYQVNNLGLVIDTTTGEALQYNPASGYVVPGTVLVSSSMPRYAYNRAVLMSLGRMSPLDVADIAATESQRAHQAQAAADYVNAAAQAELNRDLQLALQADLVQTIGMDNWVRNLIISGLGPQIGTPVETGMPTIRDRFGSMDNAQAYYTNMALAAGYVNPEGVASDPRNWNAIESLYGYARSSQLDTPVSLLSLALPGAGELAYGEQLANAWKTGASLASNLYNTGKTAVTAIPTSVGRWVTSPRGMVTIGGVTGGTVGTYANDSANTFGTTITQTDGTTTYEEPSWLNEAADIVLGESTGEKITNGISLGVPLIIKGATGIFKGRKDFTLKPGTFYKAKNGNQRYYLGKNDKYSKAYTGIPVEDAPKKEDLVLLSTWANYPIRLVTKTYNFAPTLMPYMLSRPASYYITKDSENPGYTLDAESVPVDSSIMHNLLNTAEPTIDTSGIGSWD